MLDLNRATFLLQQGYRYWDAKRAGKRMPSRADIDPIEMPALLPHVVLLEVLRDVEPDWPLDFRYRLIGSRIQAISNADYTGHWLSQIPHQRAPSHVWEHLSAAVDARAPVKGVIPYVGRSREVSGVFHIVLPLAEDGETVDHLLVCVDLAPAIRLQDGTQPFTQLG